MKVKVGDKVKVWWTSRDYGKENSIAFIYRIGALTGDFKYWFRRVKVDGTISKHTLSFLIHSLKCVCNVLQYEEC